MPEVEEALQKFEGYEVIECLRTGSITSSYDARQLTLGRRVRIKALSSNVLPSSPFAATLEREARLLSELHHEGVLMLFDFVSTAETMWMVLEHVDGWGLDTLLTRTAPLDAMAATGIALAIAEALGHAHQHGIVHRDIQPANVLVSRQGEVKLLNFSVASAERLPTAPELLDGDTGFVSPKYMSPEQVLGEAPDPRSDFFSLGTVLYEMLSGRQPFDAPDARAATQRIRHDAPPPIGRPHDELPAALERVVLRCLQKLPGDRFDDANELCQALAHVLAAGGTTGRDAISALLVTAGLTETITPRHAELPRGAADGQDSPIRRAVVVYTLVLLLLLLGGAALSSRRFGGGEEGAPRSSKRLELVPRESATLRVVADPWAHVLVDGERVATTPFAHPIPLRAGQHFIRLEHPAAPPEERSLRLAAGENVLLDVKMAVSLPDNPDAGHPLLGAPSASVAGSDAAPPTP